MGIFDTNKWFVGKKENIEADKILKSQGIGNSLQYDKAITDIYSPQTTNITKKTSVYQPYNVSITTTNSPYSTARTGASKLSLSDTIQAQPSQSITPTISQPQSAETGGMNQILLLVGVGVLGLAILKDKV